MENIEPRIQKKRNERIGKMNQLTVTTSDRKIEKRQGRKWFGRGRSLDEATSIAEVLHMGGLDWTVSKRPILTTAALPEYAEHDISRRYPNGVTCHGIQRNVDFLSAVKETIYSQSTKSPEEFNEALGDLQGLLHDMEDNAPFLPMTRDFAVVRDDLNLPLGVLGSGYSCIDNAECLLLLESMMEEGRVLVERAGTFNSGANCWVLARMPNSVSVGPEVMDQYVKISWAHDGSEKLSATFIAYMKRSEIQISPQIENTTVSIEIRHTKNAKDRIKIADQIFSKGEQYFAGIQSKLVELMSAPMSNDDMEDYLETILPDPPKKMVVDNDGNQVNKASKRNGNSRGRIMEIFANSNSQISHTKFAGMTAVAKWCDTEKTIRVTNKDKTMNAELSDDDLKNDSRLFNSWKKGGSSRVMKDKAFAAIFKNKEKK
jgi:phage/plasmid-like protein (TIGR03299 family)